MSVKDLYEQALSAFQDRKLEEARALLEEVVRSPEEAPAHARNDLASVYFYLGRILDAFAIITEANKTNPDDPLIVQNTCRIYEAVSRYFMPSKGETAIHQPGDERPKARKKQPLRPRRVLIRQRENAEELPGGDTIVAQRIFRAHREAGIETDFVCGPVENLGKYNVVHLFNFSMKEIVKAQAQECVDAGVPYLVHTMYEDWPRFKMQFTIITHGILKYMEAGYPREHWHQVEDQLHICEPTKIWDNSWSATRAAALIASGREEKRVLQRDYPSARVTAIQYGHDMPPEHDGGEAFFRHSGLRDFVLCVGRVEARKNQLMLLKALEDSPHPLVFLANDFTYEPKYSDICMEFQRKATTLFYSRLDKELLYSAYAGARVHVLPSWYELPGLASLEAASIGTEVVATEYGTARDYLGDYAHYCDPGNAASILRAVENAYKSPKQPKLKQFVSQWSWERYLEELLDLYGEVLSADRKAQPQESSEACAV